MIISMEPTQNGQAKPGFPHFTDVLLYYCGWMWGRKRGSIEHWVVQGDRFESEILSYYQATIWKSGHKTGKKPATEATEPYLNWWGLKNHWTNEESLRTKTAVWSLVLQIFYILKTNEKVVLTSLLRCISKPKLFIKLLTSTQYF